MVLQVSTLLRNAMLDMIESIGNNLTVTSAAISGTATAPTLEIRTGAPPLAPITADSGTLLVSMTLPTTFMAAASSGSVSKDAGTWQDASADATGQAGHFRMKTSTAAVFAQGTCGQQVQINTSAITSVGSNVLTFTATTGVVAGMNITGTNVPPAATVVSFTGTTVTMSAAVTPTQIANGTAITFTPDLTIDNASIVAGQQVTVTAFSVATQNG
jgi:hypothetical protein